MAVDLNNHPGKNPDYDSKMAARRAVQEYNRSSPVKIKVPPQAQQVRAAYWRETAGEVCGANEPLKNSPVPLNQYVREKC